MLPKIIADIHNDNELIYRIEINGNVLTLFHQPGQKGAGQEILGLVQIVFGKKNWTHPAEPNLSRKELGYLKPIRNDSPAHPPIHHNKNYGGRHPLHQHLEFEKPITVEMLKRIFAEIKDLQSGKDNLKRQLSELACILTTLEEAGRPPLSIEKFKDYYSEISQGVPVEPHADVGLRKYDKTTMYLSEEHMKEITHVLKQAWDSKADKILHWRSKFVKQVALVPKQPDPIKQPHQFISIAVNADPSNVPPTLKIAGQSGTFFAQPDVSLPATVPVTEVAQIVFWQASKLGFCDNPSKAALTFEFKHDEFSERFQQERSEENAAQRKLLKQGTSLEEQLPWLFKGYAEKDHHQQRELKKFVVAVLNGDVSSEIGEAFNKFTSISNKFLRNKKLSDLAKKYRDESSLQNIMWRMPLRI